MIKKCDETKNIHLYGDKYIRIILNLNNKIRRNKGRLKNLNIFSKLKQ